MTDTTTLASLRSLRVILVCHHFQRSVLFLIHYLDGQRRHFQRLYLVLFILIAFTSQSNDSIGVIPTAEYLDSTFYIWELGK